MKKKMISILTLGMITLSVMNPLNIYGYSSGYWTYKYIDGSLTRQFVSTDTNNTKPSIDSTVKDTVTPTTERSGYWTYKYIDGSLKRLYVSTDTSNIKPNIDSTIKDTTKPPTESTDSTYDKNTSNSTNSQTEKTPEQSNNENLTSDESKLIQLINEERVKAGKAPLSVDMEVMNAARLKSKDMTENKYFSHTSPTYGDVWQMLKDLNISYRVAGENIAINGSVSKAHGAFMASSGHRANILSNSYTHVGVGISKRTNGTGIIITEIFTKK